MQHWHKLSGMCGVPEHMIDQYELGKYEIKLDEILKIACVLGLRVGKLEE